MDTWVSVEDEIPDWYKWVLVHSEVFDEPLLSRRVETGSIDSRGISRWQWDFSRYVGLIAVSVTHWMPLPPPPTDIEG